MREWGRLKDEESCPVGTGAGGLPGQERRQCGCKGFGADAETVTENTEISGEEYKCRVDSTGARDTPNI